MKKVVLCIVLLLVTVAGLFLFLRRTLDPPALIFQYYSLDKSGRKVARIELTNSLARPIFYPCHRADDPSCVGYDLADRHQRLSRITNTFASPLLSMELPAHGRVMFEVPLPTNNSSGLQIETVYVPDEDRIDKVISHFCRKFGCRRSSTAAKLSVELP